MADKSLLLVLMVKIGWKGNPLFKKHFLVQFVYP